MFFTAKRLRFLERNLFSARGAFLLVVDDGTGAGRLDVEASASTIKLVESIRAILSLYMLFLVCIS